LGREGIYEIMPVSDDLLGYISAESDIQQVRDAAVSQGMKTLRMAGAQKVAAGITSIAEVLRVTPELGVRRSST
jgi:general secretion pathway protein E